MKFQIVGSILGAAIATAATVAPAHALPWDYAIGHAIVEIV